MGEDISRLYSEIACGLGGAPLLRGFRRERDGDAADDDLLLLVAFLRRGLNDAREAADAEPITGRHGPRLDERVSDDNAVQAAKGMNPPFAGRKQQPEMPAAHIGE